MSIYAVMNSRVDSLPEDTLVKIVAITKIPNITSRFNCIVELPYYLTIGHDADLHSIFGETISDSANFSDVLEYFDFDTNFSFDGGFSSGTGCTPYNLYFRDRIYYYVPFASLSLSGESIIMINSFNRSEENFINHFSSSSNNNHRIVGAPINTNTTSWIDSSIDDILKFTCDECGEEKSETFVYINDRKICSSCLKKMIKERKIFWCKAHSKFESIEKYYRNSCCKEGFEKHYVKCSLCGKYTHRDHLATTPNGNLVCDKCYIDKNNFKYFIKRYHDNPRIKYYVGNKITVPKVKNFKGYGVELEVEVSPSDYYNTKNKERMSKMTIDTMNDEVYTMRDGSVSYGFEIITFPHTEKALFEMNWKELFTKLKRFKYDGEKYGNCGLHLHISKNIFRTEKNIVKMMYFYEKFRTEIIKFSRRKDTAKVNRYSSFYTTNSREVTLDSIYNIYKLFTTRYKGHDYRYKCVNLQKKDTVEIRIMNGTTDYKTFNATLKFMIEIAKRANEIPDNKIGDYTEWLKNIDSDTIEYMKKQNCFKKLY